jgi:uncharacterized protein YjbI with pentapeptide repeats
MTDEAPNPGYAVLSRRAIVLWAVLVVAVGAGVATWLLLAYANDDPQLQLDAIRTAGTVVVGTGGAAALLLAARRQRAMEIALWQKDRDLRHQERVAAITEQDAVERRITELYAKAGDQLGSDKAPVRMAGLHALERLALTNPPHKQTVVDLFCAYLRMPFEPPDDDADAADPQARQELQVRLTAQRLLANLLRDGDDDEIDVHLPGATLVDFSFRACRAGKVNFNRARFFGTTWFDDAHLTGGARFIEAQFNAPVYFDRARFGGENQLFAGAEFAGEAEFGEVHFAGEVGFERASFAGKATFKAAEFTGSVRFSQATFAGHAIFTDVHFGHNVLFNCTFDGPAAFYQVQFPEQPEGPNSGPPYVTFAHARFAEEVPLEVEPFRKPLVD